jgi:hypothetical protein
LNGVRLPVVVDAAGAELAGTLRALAADGRYELFKTTTKYDGKTGREQHHFPTASTLPA